MVKQKTCLSLGIDFKNATNDEQRYMGTMHIHAVSQGNVHFKCQISINFVYWSIGTLLKRLFFKFHVNKFHFFETW